MCAYKLFLINHMMWMFSLLILIRSCFGLGLVFVEFPVIFCKNRVEKKDQCTIFVCR